MVDVFNLMNTTNIFYYSEAIAILLHRPTTEV